jgi:hypothetical protein
VYILFGALISQNIGGLNPISDINAPIIPVIPAVGVIFFNRLFFFLISGVGLHPDHGSTFSPPE